MTIRQKQTVLSFVALALAGCGGGGVSELGQPNRAPTAVTLNVPSDSTGTSLTLSWSQSADSDFAAYKLYRAPSSGVGQTSTLVDAIATRTTLLTTAMGLAASTTYFFRVYVCDAGGLCSGSNEVSGTTEAENPWIAIPAGEFFIGCVLSEMEECMAEQSRPMVSLPAYKIQKHEVTNAQYKLCVDFGACTAPFFTTSNSRSSYYGASDYDDYPVIWVNWFQSTAYCEWIGGRLPTEAEWKKAALGPSPRNNLFPWGDVIDGSHANFQNSGDPFDNDTTPVGNYLSGASYYGVMDMAGNVWEWVNDFYHTDDWRPWTYYSSNNLQGYATNDYQAVRGGAWNSSKTEYGVGVSSRRNVPVTERNHSFGFRCAKDF